MNTPRLAFSTLMVSVLVVTGTGTAAAQTSTTSTQTGTSSTRATTAPTTTAADTVTQCPAVHMLLAPGTSETSRFAEPNQDTHGFLSQHLARPVMGALNSGSVGDLSSGFAELLKLPEGVQSLAGTRGGGSSSQGPARQAARVSRTYVTYPATVGGAQPPGLQTIPENIGDLTAYGESLRIGIAMTEDLMGQIAGQCPDTKLFLAGFSQGAEVISNVARRTGAGQTELDPDQVAGVALFADPTRAGGTPLQPDGAATVGPVPGTDGTAVAEAITGLDRLPTANAGGLSTDKTGQPDFGQLSDRTVSWCLPGDYVCGLPVESKLVTDVVTELQGMSLGDPVAALQRLARILDRAVSVGNLSEIADFNFGGTGFSTRPDGGAETPVLSKRVQAAQAEEGITTSTSTSSTTSTSTSSATPTAGESTASTSTSTSTAAETSPQETTSASTDAATSSQTTGSAPATVSTLAETAAETVHGPAVGGLVPPAPVPPGIPGIPPLPTPEQVVKGVVDVAAGIGGMALGAGITVARKSLTPENLAQIAVAGVTGGPQAAGAVAVAKLSESAMTLLEPGTASGYARQTLQVLKDAGVPVPEQVELAVSLTAWLSQTEHNGYGDRPVLPDGRSPSKATSDWVQAIAQDVTAAGDDPLTATPRQTPDGLSALEDVSFDSDAARAALAGLGGIRTSPTASPAASTSSLTPTTTTASTTSNPEGN